MKTNFKYRIKKYSKLPKKFQKQEERVTFNCFYRDMSRKKLALAQDKYCGEPSTIFLVLEKGFIISLQKLYKRTVKYKGKKIILGGLGGLCTIKKRRKKGIGTFLLKIAIKEFQKQKCDVLFLCTDIKDPKLVRLYNKFGFVIMKQPDTFIGKSGKRYT